MACQFLWIVAQTFAFWCCLYMSSPEDTQNTEAAQELQESQQSSRNKEPPSQETGWLLVPLSVVSLCRWQVCRWQFFTWRTFF